jgi:hypothetical protein
VLRSRRARRSTGSGSSLLRALDFTAGKEWWVSDGWGLGVAVSAAWFAVEDNEVKESWKGPNLAVLFSATFN